MAIVMLVFEDVVVNGKSAVKLSVGGENTKLGANIMEHGSMEAYVLAATIEKVAEATTLAEKCFIAAYIGADKFQRKCNDDTERTGE